MTVRATAFAWVKVLALAGAAIAAVGGLMASGAVAVLLMLSGDAFTASVMVFVMGCLSFAAVVVVREMRDAFVREGRRAPHRDPARAGSPPPRAALKPPAKIL